MFKRAERLWAGESGSELVEWIVVTAILTLAIFAILQAFGAELTVLGAQVLEAIKGFLGLG